jgi:hypothetical protein
MLAHLVEGFSIDSFAFPYVWISAALISAGSLVVRKEIRDEHQLGAQPTDPTPCGFLPHLRPFTAFPANQR